MMNETKRTWVRPQANVQTFQMNDYVSACYEVTCITPRNNAEFKEIYSDSNGDGQLDWGDELLYSSDLLGGFHGDNVKERTQTYPSNNGFVVDGWGYSYPVYVFYKNDGESSIHVADLTNRKNTQAGANIATPRHPNRS